MTTRDEIDEFLSHKTLALVGASRGGRKFGNTLLRELRAKGYEILLVHPEAEQIEGVPCYPSLKALPKPVGGVVLVVPPAQTKLLVREAAAAHVTRVWMQQGAEAPEALHYCREQGITVIHGQCILMFAEPTGKLHRVHRWLNSLLGRLPPSSREALE